MRELLKKFKLIDDFKFEIEILKSEFVHKLSGNVKEDNLGYFSDLFDVFSSDRRTYKGEVDAQGFKIKRRRKFFDTQNQTALATGSYRQYGDQLIIEGEVVGNQSINSFVIFFSIFYGLILFLFLGFRNSVDIPFPVLLLILAHGVFMFSIFFFIFRRNTRKMKEDLEKEFFFMTKK